MHDSDSSIWVANRKIIGAEVGISHDRGGHVTQTYRSKDMLR